MNTHVFRDNVNIHTPGSDPGARFYAWCWHTHFTHQRMVDTNKLWATLNTELVRYNAHMQRPKTDPHIHIQFENELDHTQFLLTWS
jgi:hypothetical protein